MRVLPNGMDADRSLIRCHERDALLHENDFTTPSGERKPPEFASLRGLTPPLREF
jgi:hypothetical protein